MVSSLGSLPVENSFSVVQFATNGLIESNLTSANETLGILDDMVYAGGGTNHEEAIQKCQETFTYAPEKRKELIVIVTDGIPIVPKPDPEGAATAAAALAKKEGVSIIPLFISDSKDPDAIRFMRSLSSNDQIFDVSDFNGLENVRESLENQVACL